MNKELKKSQIRFKRQISLIIDKILSNYQPSDECMNTPSDNPLFETTCEYVGLINEFVTLSRTLSKMADYQEMTLNSEED